MLKSCDPAIGLHVVRVQTMQGQIAFSTPSSVGQVMYIALSTVAITLQLATQRGRNFAAILAMHMAGITVIAH